MSERDTDTHIVCERYLGRVRDEVDKVSERGADTYIVCERYLGRVREGGIPKECM